MIRGEDLSFILGHCYRFLYRVLCWSILLVGLLLVLLNLAARGVLLYEQDLEAWLSQSLGAPVSVDIDSSRWVGIRPEIFVSNVMFGQGEEAVRVNHLVAKPDLVRSLLTLSPSWQDLSIEGIDLSLVEHEQGGWQIAGIDLVSRGGGQATVLEKMLLGSRRINFSDVQTRLVFSSGTEIAMHWDNLGVENSLGFHRFVADAELQDEANPFTVIVELTGVSNRFSELDGIAYTRLNGGDLSQAVATLIARYSDTPAVLESQPSVTGEIWANIHSGSRAEFQGYIDLAGMPGELLSPDLGDLHFRSDLSGRFSYFDNELFIDFVEPDFSAPEREWPVQDFRLSRSSGDIASHYSLQLRSLDLEALSERVAEIYALPEQVASILNGLDPAGTVENIEVSFDSGAPLDSLLIYADLRAVDLGYFRNAPAVRNLSGTLLAGAEGGQVLVDAPDLVMQYPKVYDWWLDHKSATGKVGWVLRPEEQKISIYGEDLSVIGEEGTVKGDFFADASLVPREEGMDFYLSAGLTDSDAAYWSKFVPVKAPENLRNWLTQASPEGAVTEGSIIYRGKVKRGWEPYRSIQLAFKAPDASVQFLESWPRLEQVDLNLFVSNTEVSVTSSSAALPGIELDDILLRVDATPGVSFLDLSLSGAGETDAVLDLVRQTGLRNQVGDGLDSLLFSGQSNLSANIQMPLKNDIALSDLDIQVDLSLQGNDLLLADQNIEIEGIEGDLRFDNAGLSAEALTAQLWEQDLSISIVEDRETNVVNLKAEGQVSIDGLRSWTDVGLLQNFSGQAPVNALIQINTDRESGGPSRYLFSTSMVGIQSMLPGEFVKTAEEEALLSLSIEMSDREQWKLDWSKGLYLEMLRNRKSAESGSSFESAVLSVNAVTPGHQPGAFRGRVYAPVIDVNQWLAALIPENDGSEVDQSTMAGLTPEIDLATQKLYLGGEDYGLVEAQVSSNSVGWHLGFKNVYAEGSFIQPHSRNQIPSLHLSSLDLDKYQHFKEESSEEDPEIFDPSEIPSLDLAIESLVQGGIEKGSWSAELRSVDNGLWVENIRCEFNSLRCGLGETQSSIYWSLIDDKPHTQLNLAMAFEDVTDVFALAGMDSPLTSTEGDFYASINWDGAPHTVKEVPLSGVLGVNLTKGEFQAESNTVGAGIMRLVGLVNVDTWLRRLQLDFSDVAAGGTAYDELTGDFTINQSVVNTLSPVYVSLPSGKMLFDGSVDLNESLVDAQLVVTLPARQNMTWIAALAGGLPAAAGVWVVGQIFDQELDSLASVSYGVSGSLDELEIKTERVFDATVQ